MPLAQDLDALARTVYGEARGESDLGRLAVAYVPITRAEIAARFVAATGHRHPLYGDGTVASACHMPWQFSCWNAKDPNMPKLIALDLTSEEAQPSVWAAGAALAGSAPNPAEGATHYHTTANPRPRHAWPPPWAQGQTPVTQVGGHVFYRLG